MPKYRYFYSYYIGYLFFLIYTTSLYSQDHFNINGTIRNFDGDPITGAVITSLEENVSDTSNASGSFEIIASPITHDINQVKYINKVEVKNNCLFLALDSKKNVQIDLFNIRGIKIKSVFHGILGKGNYRIPLLLQNKSCQVYVICLKFGTSLIIKKSINIKNNLFTAQIQKPKTTNKSVKRGNVVFDTNNVIDTLVLTHADYLSKRAWIYNYSDAIDMILWDKELLITDEVTGWIDLPEKYKAYDTAQLYDLIDGGAPIYNDQGLIDGIYQYLKKGDDKTCAISVFNFGTPQKSLAMYTEQMSWVSSEMIIPGYDDSIAIGDETIGGAVIYVHFGQFDLELSFSGYADIQLVKDDAVLFLAVYESKISKISSNL